jgi:hypothetical protein
METDALGRCHRCGSPLCWHGQQIVDGYQHEEYYCDACGSIERQAIRLRLEDPVWRKTYESRQKLVARGPVAGRSLWKSRHCDAKAVRRWITEIFRLGRLLTGSESGPAQRPDGLSPPAAQAREPRIP